MTNQEYQVYNMVKGLNLPFASFFRSPLNFYIGKRERTQEGFIGYQVPYVCNNVQHWSDFSIYIPNELDVRIECKSLSKKSIGIINATFGEMMKMKDNIPEKELILFLIGEGYNNNIIDNLINDTGIVIVRSLDVLAEHLNQGILV